MDLARDVIRHPVQPKNETELYKLAVEKGAVKERLSKLNLAVFQGNKTPFPNRSNNFSNRNNSFNTRGSYPPRAAGHILDPQELARLRREGRCFYCKQIGHNARNCPRKNQPSSLNTRQANIESIEPETNYETRTGQNTNPFRDTTKPDLSTIRNAVLDLSVGDFNQLLTEIEGMPDFQ